MSGLRKAVLFATAEQYVALGANFVTALFTTRMMAASEIGIAVVGWAIVAMATAVREFATPNFFIKSPDVSPDSMRGALTGIVIANVVLVSGLALAAPLFGFLYGDDRLATFLRVMALGLLAEAFASPVVAVLRREMKFDKAATLGLVCTGVTAGVTLGLAAAGVGSLSFAWGTLCGTSAGALTGAVVRPGFWVFRPALTSWRALFAFGGYNGSNALLRQLCDSIPYLVLGQVLSPEVVAYYHRALMLSQLPGKLLLGGVEAMMLPHLSARGRRNQGLKTPFLHAVECTTALYWPALILLAVLAQPIVVILYGRAWLPAAHLLQIIALAALIQFIGKLDTAVFIATGSLSDLLKRGVIVFPVCAVISLFGAMFGVVPLALTHWLTSPIQLIFSLYFTKRQILFSWPELGSPLSRSALVALASAAGPLAVVAALWPHVPALGEVCLAGGLAIGGWLLAVRWTQHALLLELKRFEGLRPRSEET
jgi:O-antigen/teichoic acid export membrane protein